MELRFPHPSAWGFANPLESSHLLQDMLGMCPDGIIGVDRRGTITLFNEAAETLTGLPSREVVGKLNITEIYHPPELARRIKKLLHGPEHGGPNRLDGLEVEVRGAGGRMVPIRLSAILLFEDGQEVGSVGFFHDLSRQRLLEAELRRLSITDSLTGLHNRRHFHNVLAEETARAERYQRPLTLVCLDLDNFKPFNDNFGHQEGDNILRLLGDCLRGSLRAQDFAFRYGGDEFMLLLVETRHQAALGVANRFRDTFNARWPQALSHPGQGLRPVTLSMGVAQFNAGERPDNLLMRADLAMYEAKRAGGDRVSQARPCISQDREVC